MKNHIATQKGLITHIWNNFKLKIYDKNNECCQIVMITSENRGFILYKNIRGGVGK